MEGQRLTNVLSTILTPEDKGAFMERARARGMRPSALLRELVTRYLHAEGSDGSE